MVILSEIQNQRVGFKMKCKRSSCKAATVSARCDKTARWLMEPLSVISPLSMVGGSDNKHMRAMRLALPVAVWAQTATGSANRIARMCLLSEPPTIDKGEITDKGSINQRAVLSHRADTVAALHEERLHFILKPTL